MSRKKTKRPALSNTPGGVSNQNSPPGAATGQNSNGSAWPPAGISTRVVSAADVDSRLPDNVLLCDDGSVRYRDPAGVIHPCIPKVSSSGLLHIEFPARVGDAFKFWLNRAMYAAFNGRISPDHEVFPLDGNQRNLKPSNLALRPKAPPAPQYLPYVPPASHRPSGGGTN